MTQPFYRSKQWKRKRAKILRRDEYMCQQSKRYGKTEPASPVHHIFSREEYPELELEDWNLVALSDKWHNAMHIRGSHEMTDVGLEWQERKKKEFINYYKNKGLVSNPNAIRKLIEFGEDVSLWSIG